MDSINKTDMALLDKEISNEAESELGPLKYLAETTGYPMNEVVNWFLLLIIFVFDPLAIALVVAANMAFAQIRKPKNITVDGGEIEVTVEPTEEQMEEVEEENNTTEPSESLKQRVKKNQDKLKEIDEDYFKDLQDYLNYSREEPVDNITYPKIIRTIPTHDPQTGEVNPYYKELTGKENPLDKEEFDDIPEEIKDKEDQLMLEEDERRMDIIGQNGNDGLHYEDDDVDIELEDISRLTDTTKTLIVETPTSEEIDNNPPLPNKGLDSSKDNLLLTKTLRYTKRQ